MAIMGVAGELAGEQAAGPGSFQVAFLDALANVTPGDLEQRLRVQRQ
jgi:hydroxyethylthiazole kinase